MKTENKKQVPVLKLNECTLQGGFKSLTDLQKGKVKAGVNVICYNVRGSNCYRNGLCW